MKNPIKIFKFDLKSCYFSLLLLLLQKRNNYKSAASHKRSQSFKHKSKPDTFGDLFPISICLSDVNSLSSPQIECQTANKALNFKFQHKAERVWVVKREKQFPFSAVSNPPSYDFTHRIHLTPERSRWLSKIAIEDGGRRKVVGCQHGGENVESFWVWL